MNELSKRPLHGQALAQDSEACAVFPELTGAQLKAYRLQKGLTQEQFARLYELNVRTLKRWEAERAHPRYSGGFRKILAEWSASLQSLGKMV